MLEIQDCTRTTLSPSDADAATAPPSGGDATLLRGRFSASEAALAAATSAYAVKEILGQGGMGTVYRATQLRLGRDVAYKELRPEMSIDSMGPLFAAEARVMGQLEHPNIVPIHDLGLSPDGKPFLAMKLVEGESWDKLVQQKPLSENIDILIQVCQAVAFAHSRGIVHGDLKPANVMVGAFGEVLVMDWGLAVTWLEETASAGVPHRDTIVGSRGTPAYMPPEMALGCGPDVGPWTDTYLIGAMLYELVVGHPPPRE